jgi:nitric oxide reductase NorQ protein
MSKPGMRVLTQDATDLVIQDKPFYQNIGQESEVFVAAHTAKVPILLKGPTGCGKTRFVSHMAYQLGRPLISVACHEDLTASDLIGRFLLQGDETIWNDGPMTAAVRMGAILYLDEMVEARKDTIVAIHPLTDHRRRLNIDKLGTTLPAPDEFMLVVSYNPGYQSIRKEMKPSTRQRFVSLMFNYPPPEVEAIIIHKESEIGIEMAKTLSKLAVKIRNLCDRGLEEGVSTRLLVHAARLMKNGVSAQTACQVAFAHTLSDDIILRQTISQLCQDYL